MSIRLPKIGKKRAVFANRIDMCLEHMDEEVPPLIGLRVSEDEKNSVVIILTPEEASKLVNGLMNGQAKMYLNISDERKDVMYV